jgi:hypothetical protein
MLRWVAAFSHISTFIAGATSSGQRRASTSVESRSSARPCATLAMKSAVAGAITIRSRIARQLDVPHVIGDAGVPQIAPRGLAGERLQGRGADEPFRRGREHRARIASRFYEQPRQLRGFVGRYAARQSEQDPLALQCHRFDRPER